MRLAIQISQGLPAALALVGALVATPAVPAQDALYSTRSESAWDGYGVSVEALGDVDGDGVADLAVASVSSGVVRVLSGADGREQFVLRGGVGFGLTLAHGDFDGDGIMDVAVGAPLDRDALDGHEAGAVFLHSGRDGSLIHALHGGPADHHLGRTLFALGDLDGGGTDDLLIGGLGSETLVLRTEDHSTLRAQAALGAGAWQGLLASPGAVESLSCRIGDLDGDGTRDWALAPAPLVREPGGVRLILSGDPSTPRTLSSGKPDDGFGWALAGIDDVDGDGVADIVVGAPGDDTLVPDGGAVHVFSGRTTKRLFSIHGSKAGRRLGGAVCGLGDVDGDGIPDIAASAQDGAFGILLVFGSDPDGMAIQGKWAFHGRTTGRH